MNTIDKINQLAALKFPDPNSTGNPLIYGKRIGFREGYLAGASAMNGSAGGWVKSTERLPKNMEEVFIKYSYQGRKDTAIGKCNTLFPMKNWVHKNGIPLTFDQLEWLDTSVSSPSPQPMTEIIKQEKIKLIWEMIEGWQDTRRDKDIDVNERHFSAQDIEVDLYDWLEKVDPRVPAQKPSSPSPLEAETADKKEEGKL